MPVLNRHMVGINGQGIVVLLPPRSSQVLTRQEALEFAAWLVVLADPLGEEFPKMIDEARFS